MWWKEISQGLLHFSLLFRSYYSYCYLYHCDFQCMFCWSYIIIRKFNVRRCIVSIMFHICSKYLSYSNRGVEREEKTKLKKMCNELFCGVVLHPYHYHLLNFNILHPNIRLIFLSLCKSWVVKESSHVFVFKFCCCVNV